jgi:hypothetical protein
MQADALIPPDALRVKLVKSQGESKERDTK